MRFPVIYVLCILTVLSFSFYADKTGKKTYLFFCALLLSLFCGLRSTETGVDTIHYYKYLSYIRYCGIMFGSDIGFSAISYFFMGLFDNPYYPLFIYATITNFLIVYRLWDFRNECSLPLMLLTYMVLYYPYTFNIVRQFLAISIIFFATKFIEQKHYIKYIIINLITSTIHASSLMCFCYLFVSFGTKTKNKIYKILGFIAAFAFIFAGMNFFSTNFDKYGSHLVSTYEGRIHAMTFIKMSFFCMIIFFNQHLCDREFSISKNGKNVPMQKHILQIYAVGLCLYALGMIFPFMNRIGFYFIMYEMPFWGQIIRAKTDGRAYNIMIFIIIGYMLVINAFSGENADNLFYYHSFLSQENNQYVGSR